uniref:Secreted protein n=1 Tax=Panstrongylus lignarius TaxID=156445 RepID=A0A224XNJ3_9HEMI
MKSCGSLKLTKPNPLVLLVLLSRTTLAFKNEAYFEKALVRTSSVTSLPRSPQNSRKSSSSHSANVGSSQICPPAVLINFLFFFSFFLLFAPGTVVSITVVVTAGFKERFVIFFSSSISLDVLLVLFECSLLACIAAISS